jgi:hypothetical protein
MNPTVLLLDAAKENLYLQRKSCDFPVIAAAQWLRFWATRKRPIGHVQLVSCRRNNRLFHGAS